MHGQGCRGTGLCRFSPGLLAVALLATVVPASLLVAACTGGSGRRPPVDFGALRMPEGIEGDHSYRRGLDAALLPAELAGEPLREETVFQRTTEYGHRAVLGLYGSTVVMIWKAPTDEDVAAGLVHPKETEPRNAEGAASMLEKIMHGSTSEPGAYYGKELVTARGQDETGLLWFTTEGVSTLLWQVPRCDRSSFWFRSGLWFCGVEADTVARRDAAATDLVAHLHSRAQDFTASPKR